MQVANVRFGYIPCRSDIANEREISLSCLTTCNIARQLFLRRDRTTYATANCGCVAISANIEPHRDIHMEAMSREILPAGRRRLSEAATVNIC